MMPTLAGHLSTTRLTSRGERSHYRWLLSLFVGLLCTYLAKPAPVLASEATLTPVGSITKALTNQDVTVQAIISNVREPRSERAPYVVSLTEAGATLPLVYWSDMQPPLATKVKAGNLIRVTAAVSIYRDQIQLRLRDPATFIVVTEAAVPVTSAPSATNAPAAAPPTPPVIVPTTPPTATVIGAIKADWVDRVVIISGTISASDHVDKAQRLGVQDATGQIQVVLGEKALSGLSVTDLQPGRVVTVTGPVKLENGTRTIVPEAAGAVKLAPR
jgi:DNA/RNA endonuclease YhcR with UshA esterase domain